jgi:hypothetical protein
LNFEVRLASWWKLNAWILILFRKEY